jgi:hypothetical protein
MGEEAYDEFDLETTDGRSLVIRGGYCRDEVYIGICRSKDALPDDLVAVDGVALERALGSMQIGERRPRSAVLGIAASMLLDSIVEKCGGRRKWVDLLEALRGVCRERDRSAIADYARRAVRTDGGAVQLVMLALLGLTLGNEITNPRGKSGHGG